MELEKEPIALGTEVVNGRGRDMRARETTYIATPNSGVFGGTSAGERHAKDLRELDLDAQLATLEPRFIAQVPWLLTHGERYRLGFGANEEGTAAVPASCRARSP